MMPTAWDGMKPATGKKNPVTLVSTVVARNSAVQPSSLFAPIMPNRTMNPEAIPTRLKTTWANVKVSSDIPSTMTRSPWTVPTRCSRAHSSPHRCARLTKAGARPAGSRPRHAVSSARLDPAARFEQEPGPSLGFVDPDFEQARGRDVTVFLAQIVRFAHRCGELQIVLAQFRQHIERRDVVGIVVEDSLLTADLPDRPQGRATDLANPLGNRIGGGEDLVALLVQQQMVVAKVRAGDVPVEILG